MTSYRAYAVVSYSPAAVRVDSDFRGDDVVRVRASPCEGLVESVGCEVLRDLEPVHDAELSPSGLEVGIHRRRLERTPRRQLLVWVGDEEPASVELCRRGSEVGVICGEWAEAGDVHAEDVVTWVPVCDPVRQGKADASALGEAGHHATSCPEVAASRYWPD